MCRDPILQKDTQEAGPLYLFPGCPLNDFTLGPTFQRSIASHHYTEDQGLPTRAPLGETKGSYLKRAATFSAEEPNGAVLHTGRNSGCPVVVTSDGRTFNIKMI